VSDDAPTLLSAASEAATVLAADLPVATGRTVATISAPSILPRPARVDGEQHAPATSAVRYEEVELLGAGGLGEVVAARDNDIMRTVAIKRLLPGLDAPGMIDRFVDEIRIVGRLEHPNIVPVHDVGRDDGGQLFFVMKHVKGETLESIIAKLDAGDPETHAHYSFERRTRIFVDVLEAVSYAHAQGIVHRDIKPANIMIGQFGEVMVMDWGISTRVEDQGEDGIIGTPHYMSPEQARGERLDERSDIYSLCAMFHELLCLRQYLADCESLPEILAAVQEREPTHPSFVPHAHQPKVPADLGWFVLGGLDKDPDGRYPSVDAMINRLQRRDDGFIPVQCPVTFTKSITNGWTRVLDAKPMLAIVGAALAVLTLVGATATAVVLGVSAL